MLPSHTSTAWRRFAPIILLCALLPLGCDSTEDEPEFAIEARVNGQAWEADELADFRPITIDGVEGSTIYGISTDSVAIWLLTTMPITGAGEYAIAGSDAPAPSFYRDTGAGGPPFQATSGRVDVTRLVDGALYGTFQMEARAADGQTVSVTNGRITELTTRP